MQNTKEGQPLSFAERYPRQVAEVRDFWAAHSVLVLHGPNSNEITAIMAHASKTNADHNVLPLGSVVADRAAADTHKNPYIGNLLRSWTKGETVTQDTSIKDFLASRAEQVDFYGDPKLLLAPITNMEQCFNGDSQPINPHALTEFMQQLADAASEVKPVRLLLGVEDSAFAGLYNALPAPTRFGFMIDYPFSSSNRT